MYPNLGSSGETDPKISVGRVSKPPSIWKRALRMTAQEGVTGVGHTRRAWTDTPARSALTRKKEAAAKLAGIAEQFAEFTDTTQADPR